MTGWIVRRHVRQTALRLVAMVLAWIMSSAQLSAAEHIVEIEKFKFVPEQLTVRLGDTIKWINRDIAPHTATARDRTWDTKRLKKGEAMSVVVSEGMQMDYFCLYHPHMKAKLVLDTSR
ncbi:MAG: cupredoxin family copper-binding protein [Hyphomicrobiaceae bacterium]